MKAKQILEWICRESINGEFLNIVDVPDEGDNKWEQNEEWWTNMFGACPPQSIASGTYVYYYRSAIGDYAQDEFDNYVWPDAEIELPTKNGFDYIDLYRITDERYASCVIQWKNDKEKENVTISLDGSDGDGIFFVCHTEDEFKELLARDNGEDFDIINYQFINKL